jgi:hypothetical protein
VLGAPDDSFVFAPRSGENTISDFSRGHAVLSAAQATAERDLIG